MIGRCAALWAESSSTTLLPPDREKVVELSGVLCGGMVCTVCKVGTLCHGAHGLPSGHALPRWPRFAKWAREREARAVWHGLDALQGVHCLPGVHGFARLQCFEFSRLKLHFLKSENSINDVSLITRFCQNGKIQEKIKFLLYILHFLSKRENGIVFDIFSRNMFHKYF